MWVTETPMDNPSLTREYVRCDHCGAAYEELSPDDTRCWVTTLPDGTQHYLRVWKGGGVEAAWRANPWDRWSPPLEIEERP